MIPESFIQDVLTRTDIVALVERYVPLKKAGANYSACCPFHNEKSPSFTVSPTKQFYHCFGCGAHGTAIGFLMEYSGMNFRDAVKDLAQQAGMQVPDDDAPQPDRARTSSLLEAMTTAARYFREQLRHAPQAIEYLKQRGLTGEIARQFGVGYAPDDWNGLRSAFGSQYDNPALVEAGLLIQNDAGRRYDRFRDRIMFPILDTKGNIVGFGGRVLGAGEPKYLNSPETPLFEKGRELYGLFQARQAIREAGMVVVTEGYMDVVALAQYGFGAAVATLGTATTGTHIQKLFRQAEKVVFCFDGDKAGRKAARRALENCLEYLGDDREVRFLFLPPEHDPDSYVRAEGVEAFRRAASGAMPLSEFLLRELRGELNLATAEDRAHLIHEAKALVPRIAAPVLQLQTIKLLAEAAEMEADEVARALGLRMPARNNSNSRFGNAPRAPRAPRTAPPAPLRQVLRLLTNHPTLGDRLPGDAVQLAGDGADAELLQAYVDTHDHHGLSPAALAALYEAMQEGPARELLGQLLQSEEDAHDEAGAALELEGCLTNLRIALIDHEISALQQRVSAGEALSAEEMQAFVTLPAQKQALRAGQKAL